MKLKIDDTFRKELLKSLLRMTPNKKKTIIWRNIKMTHQPSLLYLRNFWRQNLMYFLHLCWIVLIWIYLFHI